jgi:hypothetical protein
MSPISQVYWTILVVLIGWILIELRRMRRDMEKK